MKKFLLVMLMVLILLACAPAQAAVDTLADFTFDSAADYANGGNAKAVVQSGSPEWVAEYEGRSGVMKFDGDDILNIVKLDGSSLLTNCTDLTVSFYCVNLDTSGDWQNSWVFTAHSANTGHDQWWGCYHIGVSENKGSSNVRAERALSNGAADGSITGNAAVNDWHHVEVRYTASGMELYIDGSLAANNSNANDLTEILGSNSSFFLGGAHLSNNRNYVGYIDDLKITGEKSIRAALNPFNNFGSRQPALYGSMTLKEQGSDTAPERIVFPVAEGAKITLPSEESLRDGFTLGDKTYVLEGDQENPRKLIGWYNLADGKYYSVLNGDAQNVTLTGKNDVFYGDWVAESYDFLGDNTDGLITTADTSDFIDINVYDYSELVNVNSMTVNQNGVGSESWSVFDNRENGWLAFSDYGTYQPTGSIGFPNNRDNTVHGYTGVNANPGVLDPADKIISTMFNTASKPGSSSYVPGINYLGKGNYLFKYDPATGMYSYDCETNAAVYQQSEGRFYVYDSPITYYSDGEQPDFFPLNKKTDSLYKENGVPNYWFGMDFAMDFWLPDNSGSTGNQITNADGSNTDMIFTFIGDDDMWVLIDGKLVLDIGGIHDPVEGTINFSTGDVTVKNENGATTKTYDFTAGDHKMEIYYLERGGDKSNCTIKFNLLPEYEVKEPGIDTVKIVKEWKGNPPELPATITVELYDENDPADVIKTATLAKDEEGNWSHSFSNLPHTNSKGNVIKYSVRETGSNPNFKVNVDGEVHVYSNAWVFTDQSGLKSEKYVVIGNGKGQVLGADLKAHSVTMDVDNNIITKLPSDSTGLLWEVVPAADYTGGKHFYLKNGDQYLCISSGSDDIHLHDANDVLSVFYLNASGDLQDATTGHRLVATKGGFAVDTNVGGNVTTESANKASLYVLRESETTAYSFTITNTYINPNAPMGTLEISKTIGGNAASEDDEFTFLVTLKDADGSFISGTYDGYTFTAGQTTVTLKGGKKVSILLPAGAAYTVTESDANGYELTSPASGSYTGTIPENDTALCPFQNVKNLYSLTVNKQVSGNAADEKKAFAFTVTLTDANGKALTGKFGDHTFDANGQCTVSIAHGGSFTIKELPDGTKFAITEDSDGYTITAPTLTNGAYTGAINEDDPSVTFTNVRDVVRLVKATNPTGLTVAPKVTVTGSDGSTVTAEALTANDGTAWLEIPVKPGVTYTVAEANQELSGYAFAGQALSTADANITVTGLTFSVAKNDLEAIPVLTLTNTYAQGGLTVSKTIGGNAADKNDEFVFTVTLTGADGKAVSGTFGEHTFDANGQCKITLKGGESVNFADLPVGANYTVTEEPAEGYTLVAPTSGTATGVISTTPAVASFTNERWAVDIEKKAVGLTGTDTVAPKVTVGDVVIDKLPADGVTTERVYVTPGQTYAVTEVNAEVEGYTLVSAVLSGDAALSVSGMNFTFPKDGMTTIPVLTLTNTYAQGGLTISKTIGGNAADANDEFIFTVTLTDADGKPVVGTFGEHTFVDGKTNVTLKGGESASFADLPIGTAYTVTEEPAEGVTGYVRTAPVTETVTGTISTEPALVSFTNERWAVDIQKKAVGLTGTDTVAPKVTVGDVAIAALPAGGAAERVYVTPGQTYAVAETNAEVEGYTLVSTTLTGSGSGLTVNGMGFTLADTSTEIPVLTLTNTYAQGGLTISKIIAGNAADANDEFIFTVQLTDAEGKPVTGTFGEHTFVDGKTTVTLKGGESASFADLPIGANYTVSEAPAEGVTGYVRTAPATETVTGTISTEPSVVSFTNVRDVVRLVKVTNLTDLTVAPKVTVSGSDGSVVTAEALTANNAAKYLEIPVKPGVTYTVAESGQEVAGYTFTGQTLTKDANVTVSGMTFTVEKSGMAAIPVLTLTNTYAQDDVALTIRKASAGLSEGVAYPAPKVSIFPANSTTPVWTGTLTPNGAAQTLKLQPGKYTVKEEIDEVKDHSFTSVLYVNGAASADFTFTLTAGTASTELRLDNFYAAEFSTLTLSKTVTGESGSKTAFSFRITLTDANGKPVTESFPYIGTLDGVTPVTGVVTSGSTIALRHGGSITVKLPLGVRYKVEEAEQAGYTLVSAEGEEGVIAKGGAKAAFVNKPQYTVTVMKLWEGDTEETRPASVQVQLLLNGKPVGEPVTLSAAKGWKHAFTGLDAKGPYTVEELNIPEGYLATADETQANTFVITNSYIELPPTGDSAHPALYLLALVGSAALLGLLLRKRKSA